MDTSTLQTALANIPKLAYSISEAEIASGLSRSTICRAIAAGALTSIKRGKRRLVPAQALEDFLQPSETRQ